MTLANHIGSVLLEELEALQERMEKERALAEAAHRRAFPERVVMQRRMEIEMEMQC